MLAEGPPAEIVGLFEIRVRTFKERDVAGKEVPRLVIWIGIRVKLLVLYVEFLDVVLEGLILQHRCG